MNVLQGGLKERQILGPLETEIGSKETIEKRLEKWGKKGSFNQKITPNHLSRAWEGKGEKSNQVGSLIKKFGAEKEQFGGGKSGFVGMDSGGVRMNITPACAKPMRSGDEFINKEIGWNKRRSPWGDINLQDDSQLQQTISRLGDEFLDH